jgi:hypothetical protein
MTPDAGGIQMACCVRLADKPSRAGDENIILEHKNRGPFEGDPKCFD